MKDITKQIIDFSAEKTKIERMIIRHLMDQGWNQKIKDEISKLDFYPINASLIDYLIRNDGFYEIGDCRQPRQWPSEEQEQRFKSLAMIESYNLPLLRPCIDDLKQLNLKIKTCRIIEELLKSICCLPAEDVIDKARLLWDEVTITPDLKQWSSFSDLMDATNSYMQDLKSGKIIRPIMGLNWWDDCVRTQKGDFLVLAARPGLGKTALILNLLSSACKNGQKAALLELEMEKESVGFRILSAETNVYHQYLKNEKPLEEQDSKLIKSFYNHKKDLPAYFNTTPGLSWEQIERGISHIKATKNIDFVFIDNLSLIKTSRKVERLQEVAYITKNMKILARKLGIVLICVVHMNRKIEERLTKEPMMSDLRESGTIEQDADSIVFLTEDDPKAVNENAITINLWIKKARHGATGIRKLEFDKRYQRFSKAKEKEQIIKNVPALNCR